MTSKHVQRLLQAARIGLELGTFPKPPTCQEKHVLQEGCAPAKCEKLEGHDGKHRAWGVEW